MERGEVPLLALDIEPAVPALDLCARRRFPAAPAGNDGRPALWSLLASGSKARESDISGLVTLAAGSGWMTAAG